MHTIKRESVLKLFWTGYGRYQRSVTARERLESSYKQETLESYLILYQNWETDSKQRTLNHTRSNGLSVSSCRLCLLYLQLNCIPNATGRETDCQTTLKRWLMTWVRDSGVFLVNCHHIKLLKWNKRTVFLSHKKLLFVADDRVSVAQAFRLCARHGRSIPPYKQFTPHITPLGQL